MRVFTDRCDAGRQLGLRLQHFANRAATVVLALPRGGVPVAAEIARQLKLPLDLLVVRKLGAPGQPELAMGAIATGGVLVMNPKIRASLGCHEAAIDAIAERELQELQRRELAYRGTRARLNVRNQTAIVVDDGAATGASMRAAVRALRSLGARHIVVALPVCSLEAEQNLIENADEVICLAVPPDFYAVGQWYEIFDQINDAEVTNLLHQCDASA